MASTPCVLLLLVFLAQVFTCPVGVIQQCNDGNTKNGDGCSADCQIEDGWKCPNNETVGDCVCYCVQPGQQCGCKWHSSGSGAPLPRIVDFEKVGVRFDPASQSTWVMQGLRFERSGCNKNVKWTDSYKGEPGSNGNSSCKTGGTSLNEGLTLKVAYNADGKVDYSDAGIDWINWVGTPIRSIAGLERLAFECPVGKVPTAVYFQRAGCNSVGNISTYAWTDKFTSYQYPGCMAGSQPWNDGLSLVAECRPEPSLANGMWKWIDAFGGQTVNPSDLTRVGGLCPAGSAMTGAHFNAGGCGQSNRWNQLTTPGQIRGKCAIGQRGPGNVLLSNGLTLRLKCTRYGKDIFECGPLSSHNELPCDANAQCVSSPFGGTRCVCNTGYEGTGRNKSCTPIDFCKDPDVCAAAPGGVCTYTGPGTFQCSCAAGYSGDGKLCRPNVIPSVANTTNLYPFTAQCMLGGRGGKITGTVDFVGLRSTNGDPLGVTVSVKLAGQVDIVTRWDIRSNSVDTSTGENLDACWDAGLPYPGAGRNGLTSKQGKLRANMRFNDPDIKLWGPNNVIGRSIVFEEVDGDYVGCCTIHQIGNNQYLPEAPRYLETSSGATCNFDDGRQVTFTQLTASTGAAGNGEEDRLWGHAIGTNVRVNPPAVVLNQNFASATDANVWRTNANVAPPIARCPATGAFLLGGLTNTAIRGYHMQYTFPAGFRQHRQIRIEMTFHALGSWENEWARVEIRETNPVVNMVVWERKISTAGGDCAGSANRFLIDVVYTLDRPHSNGALRVYSTLDGGAGAESFAISNVKITLQPVASTQIVRNKPFSGSSDLSAWSVVATNGQKTPPRVGQCLGQAGVSLLGGLSVIRTGEVLEYKKIVAPFTRLHLRTRFWFNKNWNGNTAVIQMVRDDGNGAETITLFSRTFTHNPASNINCDGGQFRDSSVDVDVTGAFARSTSTAWIKFFVTGTLTAPASFSISSFFLESLPTQTAIDIYQDKFRAGRTPNWFFVNNAGTRTAVGTDFNYCEGSQSSVNRYFNSGLGSDRVVMGGLNRAVYYTQSGLRPFDKVLLTFDLYMIGSWDGEQMLVEVDGIGIVWRHKWVANRVFRSFCRQTRVLRGGNGIHIFESVLVDWPTADATRTSIGVKFRSTTNQAISDEAFTVGSLRVTLLPDDKQLRTVVEDSNAGRFLGGVARWTSPGGPILNFQALTPENRQCTIPLEKTPAVAVNGRTAAPTADRTHNLLGYRQGFAESIRYRSTSSRPFTKAIVSFYFWWLDSWNGEWSYARVKTDAPFDTTTPMRFLFRETFHKLEAFYPPFCGNTNTQDNNFPDEVRYRSYIHLERSPVSNLEVWWGNTLNGVKTNEAHAVSRFSYTTLPEVPLTRIVGWSSGQFNTAAARAAFRTNGGTARTTVCKGETSLLGLGGGSSISYTLPAQANSFNTFRVHFRFWFAGTWDGERATLYATSREGEWINLWRSDWNAQSALVYNANTQRIPGVMFCAGNDLGRRNAGFDDIYEDVFVEGSFFSRTTQFTLVWGTTLDQSTLDETFAVSHVDIQIAPVQSAATIANENFASTGDSLNGWEAQTELGAWGPPVVSPCGPAGNQDFLVGGRTRLSPLQKMRWTSTLPEVAEPFQVAHIYFRYWFLPTWPADARGTMQVQEVGKTSVDATWTMAFPFALSQPTNTAANPLDCTVKRTMFRDVGFTVDFKRDVRAVVLTWGIDAGPSRVNTPRFAISVFRFDVEQPFPDWVIQGSCAGSTFRPDDGHAITAGGVNFGLGDMTNKHGPLVKNRLYIDNGVLVQGPYSVIGKTIALYKRGTKIAAGCCSIRATGPALGNPPLAPQESAGCVWSNKNTEGYVGFRSPSSVRNGLNVIVWARFFGTEATGRHAYTLNYNGFGLPQIQSPNPVCSLDLVGQILGTASVGSEDFVGPSSVALGFGNPVFPGTSGPGLTGSSRSRMGDLSGKHGTLKDMSPAATDEIRYTDGQLSFTGPWSVIGRSIVVYSLAGTPIGCCTIGFGPVGRSDSKLDFFDALGNYSQPLGPTEPEAVPFLIPDGEGLVSQVDSETYPFWNVGRIVVLVIGLVAFLLLLAAIAAFASGGGAAGGVADAGDGYVAM